MGLKGELELVDILRGYGLHYEHRLRQRKITDFLKKNDSPLARAYLEKNRELPRKQYTYEVDILAWKPGHWGALAIEQKTQFSSPKTLYIGDGITMHNGATEFRRQAQDLFLQCCGSGYLGQAYCAANGMDRQVIPVGVVDYDISIGGVHANWAFHRGVFFVHSNHFSKFLGEFLKKDSWIKQLFNSCN